MQFSCGLGLETMVPAPKAHESRCFSWMDQTLDFLCGPHGPPRWDRSRGSFWPVRGRFCPFLPVFARFHHALHLDRLSHFHACLVARFDSFPRRITRFGLFSSVLAHFLRAIDLDRLRHFQPCLGASHHLFAPPVTWFGPVLALHGPYLARRELFSPRMRHFRPDVILSFSREQFP